LKELNKTGKASLSSWDAMKQTNSLVLTVATLKVLKYSLFQPGAYVCFINNFPTLTVVLTPRTC